MSATGQPGPQVSAADIEKFAYCPLSWWLSRNIPEGEDKELLDVGTKLHNVLTDEIATIPDKERKMRESETIVFWFATGASIIAMTGVSFVLALGFDTTWILAVLALIWLLASTYFLYMASRAATPQKRLIVERIIAIFAVVAMLIALNAVVVLNVEPFLAEISEIAALIWLIVASVFLHKALKNAYQVRRTRDAHLITGEVKYVDAKRYRPELLVSKKYNISGRPDFVIELEGEFIPVEVKTGRIPRGPLFSHILQVAAYCMILGDAKGPCTHGIIRYGNIEHEVELDEGLRTLVLAKAEEIRDATAKGEAHRNHNRSGKCLSCSRRGVCPEKLT